MSSDRIYYNFLITSSENVDASNDPKCYGIDNRNDYLVTNPKDYYLSIVRFQMNVGTGIPLWVPTIQIGANKDATTLYIGMDIQASENNSATVYRSSLSKNIIFESQRKDEKVQTPTVKQDISTKYYWVDDYQWFCKIINDNVATLNASVQADLESAGKFNKAIAGFPQPPKLVYDPSTERFTWLLDTIAYATPSSFAFQSGGSAGSYEYVADLYHDSNTHGLLGFPHEKMGNDNTNTLGVYGFNYKLRPSDDYGRSTISYGGNSYYSFQQDYSTLSNLWCPIRSIVFISNLIGSKSEYNSKVIEFKDEGQVSSTSSAPSEKIVSDLEVPIFSSSQLKQQISYSPGSEWRLIDLTDASKNLKRVDLGISLRWKINNELLPLELYNGATVSAKLAFVKKTSRH